MFQHITVCLDMRGCPNRCRHCWIGHAPNARLPKEALIALAEAFRPFAKRLTVYDWYREPDYGDDYREMWELCGRLSDARPEHFELVSFWRLARDPDYGPYLASLGVRRAQLTLFGGRARTDQYTGRANAFAEILQAVEALLQNRIHMPGAVFFQIQQQKTAVKIEVTLPEGIVRSHGEKHRHIQHSACQFALQVCLPQLMEGRQHHHITVNPQKTVNIGEQLFCKYIEIRVAGAFPALRRIFFLNALHIPGAVDDVHLSPGIGISGSFQTAAAFLGNIFSQNMDAYIVVPVVFKNGYR